MIPVSFLRLSLIVTLLPILFLPGSGFGEKNAYAGTPDKSGNNAEVVSIAITPDPTPARTHPEITCLVSNTSSPQNGINGNAIFDVLASITAPNGSKKSLLWHDVSFTAGQRKLYKYGKDYDTRQAGIYKVVYSVYNSSRSYLYASLSKSFTITGPAITQQPGPLSTNTVTAPQAATNLQPRKALFPEPTTRPEAQVQRQMITAQPQKPATYDRSKNTDLVGERIFFGIGTSANTLNFSAGPSLVVWPFKNVAVQGTYGFGTFTSYEARAFYRFPVSQRLNPYLGAGYIHAERNATVIGVDSKIPGASFTAFGGVELAVYRNLHVYADVSGTPMKLKKDVTTTTQQATATVKYSPVTISAGLVFYLF